MLKHICKQILLECCFVMRQRVTKYIILAVVTVGLTSGSVCFWCRAARRKKGVEGVGAILLFGSLLASSYAVIHVPPWSIHVPPWSMGNIEVDALYYYSFDSIT